MTYADFLTKKSQVVSDVGFEPTYLPDCLKPFQRSLVEWSVRKGRSAVYAACGLGKSLIELVWAENMLRRTGKPILIATPLAVAGQFVREGEKFGIECHKVREGKRHPGINVTNYEQLHYYDPDDFGAAVFDEAGAIKDFTSRRRKNVTEFLRRMPYRLLATATPAPNDYIELGTASEALGELGYMDMLARFFKNEDKTLFLHGTKYGDMTQKHWRFKAHAEEHFWRWVCSWARACRKPSDVGAYDDAEFVLPPLIMNQHEVKASTLPPGCLFDLPATTMSEQREEQRRTIRERCEKVAVLAHHNSPVVVWANLNNEADLCEKLIPGAVQICGADSDDKKEDVFAAFTDGKVRVLVTKPKIASHGLNWQHCAHQTFFPTYSYETYHQCVRRSWRFGQKCPVVVDMVTTDGSAGVLAALLRKSIAADKMFGRLVELMCRFNTIARSKCGFQETEVPAWLS